MDTLPPPPALLDQLRSLIFRRAESAAAFDVFKQDEAMSHSLEVQPIAKRAIENVAAAAAIEIDTYDAEISAVLNGATDHLLREALSVIDEDSESVEAVMLNEIYRRSAAVSVQ
jgi:hypothetical protein